MNDQPTGVRLVCPTCSGKGELSRENASFGILVATRRKQVGLTQEQLALKVSLSRAAIANIECGRAETSIDNLRAFAAALDLPLEDLIP